MIQRINPILLMRRPGHKQLQRVGASMYAKAAGVPFRSPNLWRDDPDSLDSGWTDNGDGTYTNSGSFGHVTQITQSGELVDGESYDVSFSILQRTSGNFSVRLYADTQGGATALYSAEGDFEEKVTISTPEAIQLQIRLQASGAFVGTVGNIYVGRSLT